jgi:hypothetical protein
VLDFKRESTMKSYAKKTDIKVFKSVRIGNHDGYYRAVIELDGLYKCDLKKTSVGYMLLLK